MKRNRQSSFIYLIHMKSGTTEHQEYSIHQTKICDAEWEPELKCMFHTPKGQSTN